MNFDDEPSLNNYQHIAQKSAIYPGKGTPLGLVYCALKLNGEAGEFAEHVGKALRDDDLLPLSNGDDGRRGDTQTIFLEDGSLLESRHLLLVKEVGDVLWYLSAICAELGISLKQAAQINFDKLHQRCLNGTLQGSGDNR